MELTDAMGFDDILFANRIEEKTKTMANPQFVQQRLEDKLLGKFVTLKNVQLEKYGRLLCDVYLEEESNESINDWLLKNNFAVVYDGGTKNSPDNWSEYLALKHNNFV